MKLKYFFKKYALSILIAVLLIQPIWARPYTTPVPPEPINKPKINSTTNSTKEGLTSLKQTITKAISAKQKHLENLSKVIIRLAPNNSTELIKKLTELKQQLEVAQKQIASANTKEQLQASFKTYIKKQKQFVKDFKKALIIHQKNILKKRILVKLKKLIEKINKVVSRLEKKGLVSKEEVKIKDDLNNTYAKIEKEINGINGDEDIKTLKNKIQTLRNLIYEFKKEAQDIVKILRKSLNNKK